MMREHGAEIRPLLGYDKSYTLVRTLTPFILLQLYLGSQASRMSWPVLLLLAYAVGGTITHSTFLAIHEITHYMCFKSRAWNNLYALFVNFIVPLPYAMTFQTYHKDHHHYLGWDGVDVDIPTEAEAALLSNTLGKFFFLTFQVAFYALRPGIVSPLFSLRRDKDSSDRLHRWHVLNVVTQILFDVLFVRWFGWAGLGYFALSVLLGTGWHPLAGHFISEHFVMPNAPTASGGVSSNLPGDQETFSYYGPLNIFMWNAGYHVEHHDFANIPFTKLKELRRIAPEYYENLQVTTSWPGTLFNFLLQKDVGLRSRVVRERRETKTGGSAAHTLSRRSRGSNHKHHYFFFNLFISSIPRKYVMSFFSFFGGDPSGFIYELFLAFFFFFSFLFFSVSEQGVVWDMHTHSLAELPQQQPITDKQCVPVTTKWWEPPYTPIPPISPSLFLSPKGSGKRRRTTRQRGVLPVSDDVDPAEPLFIDYIYCFVFQRLFYLFFSFFLALSFELYGTNYVRFIIHYYYYYYYELQQDAIREENVCPTLTRYFVNQGIATPSSFSSSAFFFFFVLSFSEGKIEGERASDDSSRASYGSSHVYHWCYFYYDYYCFFSDLLQPP
eukprot:gene11558-7965_t